MRESNLSVPDADALIRLADALDTSVQALLGQTAGSPAEPSELAEALMRINDQLAIQNRRRSRIWKVAAWMIVLFVAFNLLLMVLAYAGMVHYEETVVTTQGTIVMEE